MDESLGVEVRLLFLNRSYYPDVEATGQLLTELCTDLANRHQVAVIAGQPNFVDCPTKLPSDEIHGGVRVLRVRNLRFTKKSLLGRGAGLLSYLVLAVVRAMLQRRPDAVVVETDPPALGAVGALIKWWHRCPMIFYLQDLFPEVGIALGKFKPGLLTSLLRWLTNVGLRHADRVIVLGDDMRRCVIERGVSPERVEVIHNWADTALFRPRASVSPLRKEWGVEEPFVVMYSGNLGLSQGLDSVLDAAAELRGQPIAFLFVGEGGAKEHLARRAANEELSNVRFLPYQPKARLGDSLTAADIHLIPMQRGLAGFMVPSKLYGILAAGRPYIAAVDAEGEVARITEEFRTGLRVAPGDAAAMAAAIRWCFAHRAELRSMGERGRRTAETHFDRRQSVARFEALLQAIEHARVPATRELRGPRHESILATERMTA